MIKLRQMFQSDIYPNNRVAAQSRTNISNILGSNYFVYFAKKNIEDK